MTARLRENELSTRGTQFDTEIVSTRFEIEDPNWHRSRVSRKECEWKQGESAVAKKEWDERGANQNSLRQRGRNL